MFGLQDIGFAHKLEVDDEYCLRTVDIALTDFPKVCIQVRAANALTAQANTTKCAV